MNRPRPGEGAGADSDYMTAEGIVAPAPAGELLHGTPAELESWLRAVSAGRPWWPQPDCGLCRGEVVMAA